MKKVYGNIETCVRHILGIIPFVFIVMITSLHLVATNKIFSEKEKRYMTQRPTFHINYFIDSSYQKRFEEYFSDQFPFRNFWVYLDKFCL